MNLIKGFVLGTFFLIVAGVLVLFCMGLRPGANAMESEVVIARPPEVVWRWITDPTRVTQWVSWLADVRQDSTTADGIGSRQTWTLHDPNSPQDVTVIGTVTAQDRPHYRRVHVRTPGMFSGDYTYTLTPVDGGTRLSQSAKFRYEIWVARLMEPLVTPQARKKAAGDQAKLKQLAEAEPLGADSVATDSTVAAP